MLAHCDRRRWHLHFTPTSSSWLNLIEHWFKELTDRRLRRGVFTSVADLTDADLAEAHPDLTPEARSVLGVDNAIKAFKSYGSTAPAEVAKQLALWKERLST